MWKKSSKTAGEALVPIVIYLRRIFLCFLRRILLFSILSFYRRGPLGMIRRSAFRSTHMPKLGIHSETSWLGSGDTIITHWRILIKYNKSFWFKQSFSTYSRILLLLTPWTANLYMVLTWLVKRTLDTQEKREGTKDLPYDWIMELNHVSSLKKVQYRVTTICSLSTGFKLRPLVQKKFTSRLSQ